MALILELVRPDGTRTWQRVSGPLTVGRALSNDVILDDPYADARHARIAPDGDGVLHVEDLGSVNGLVVEGRAGRERGRLALRAGDALRVGRTLLRVRDSEEALAPALADEELVAAEAVAPTPGAPPPAVASAGRMRRAQRWANTAAGRVVIMVVTMAAFALATWLGNSEKSTGSDVFAAVLALAMFGVLWATGWAVASRIVVHRSNFMGHLMVLAPLSLAFLALTILSDWLNFLLPDTGTASVLSSAVSLVLVAALVAWHLSLSSHMPRARRWRAGAIVSATFLAIGGLATLTTDEPFSDVPTFDGTLKPVPAALVPTRSVEDFGGVMRDLREDVDELAQKQREEQDADDVPAVNADAPPPDSAAQPQPRP